MTPVSDTPLTQAATGAQAADALRLTGISLKRGRLRLDGIGLQVPAGGITTLGGPVGSGKSTLAAAVAGVVSIACGKIAVGGHEVTSLPPERRRVGWVPQDAGLFPRQTAFDQIAFPLKVRGVRRGERSSRTSAIAKEWGVEALLDRTPDRLSGGQRRLVAIARAVASDPAVLLLDESLASLDATERRRTLDRLDAWRSDAGRGVLVLTHRAEEVPAATHAYRIEGGTVMGD